MPRYDSSTDDDLKKSLQTVREKDFFLGQYRKRKFVIDDNVVFDVGVSEEIKKTLNCTDMNCSDALSIYKELRLNSRLGNHVLTFLKKITEKFLVSENITGELFEATIFLMFGSTVTKIINELQWNLAGPELLQKGVCIPNLNNKEICQALLSDQEIYGIVEKLTYISLRYGLLITDLCSDFTEINISQDVNPGDLLCYIPFFHYKSFDVNSNEHILQEDDSLYRKRLLKYIESCQAGKPIKRLEAAAAKKALTNIVPGSLYSNSVLIRRAGLWLWDNCDNPLTKQKIERQDAITKLLSKIMCFKFSDESTLKRELKRVYDVTKKSIQKGEILPIEDGKKKK